MKTIVCEACGKLFSGRYAVIFPVVPNEVATLQGIHDSRTVTICLECSHQLPTWYQKTISTIVYNDNKKHFRDKTPNELVKEYEFAFESFTNFQRRTHI